MYGVEPQVTGLGGLAAQAPQDLYFGQALGIPNQDPQIAAPPGVNTQLPFNSAINTQQPGSLMAGPQGINLSGTAATVPVHMQSNHWSQVLDFHNSVAPWILLAILVLYGWLHASARVSAGRASASAVL